MEQGGKIAIIVNGGKVAIRVKMGNLTQDELAMLITNLELLRLDLLNSYRKSIKRFYDNEPEK